MDAVVFVLLGIFFWLICAFVTASIAKSKGRDYAPWWIAGLLLGLIGVIWAAAMPAVANPPPEQPVVWVATQPVAWAATHEVPVGGIQAFGRRDPYGESIVIPEHTQLRLDETLGAWGKVTNANGVSRWVNAEILIPLNAAPSIRCPSCAELIQRQAVVCRWCGRDLPGRGSAEPPPPPAP